jgi:protein gp37
MTTKTSIPWTDVTWNPITGCTPISEGCMNCYASKMAKRLKGRFGYPKENPFQPGTLHEDKLYKPLKWKRHKKIFVCSMGDLFHEKVKEETQRRVSTVIGGGDWHTYIVLTKRPELAKTFYEGHYGHFALPENMWLGVSTENQRTANERIQTLIQINVAVKFISAEPLLGPIKIPNITKLSQVIVGPETGPGARPCKHEWIEDIYDQCQAAGVAFFDKRKEGWIAREFPLCKNNP